MCAVLLDAVVPSLPNFLPPVVLPSRLVSLRFSKSLASSGKKARRSPGGGSGGRGRDGGGGDLGSLLGQLGGR